MRNKLLFPFLLCCLCCVLCLPCRAAEEAVKLNNRCSFYLSNGQDAAILLDGSGYTQMNFPAGGEITISCGEEMAGLYIEFARPPESYTVIVDGAEQRGGEHGFLHEYLDLDGLTGHEITLRFESATQLCDLYILSAGTLPGWVQDWQEPWDRADVLLLPTHSDDDQLYFAGVIPWCIDRGARIQVAYFIQHFGDGDRMNELLDGLWTSGLRNYPVLGEFRDLGFITYKQTITFYNNLGVMWEDLEGRQVALYRRFRPQVVVTHAADGEYGHGAHILYEMISVAAAELSGSEDAYPESAALYGVWDVPKVYVHNYGTTPILLDLDSPLAAFGGETAFHIAQEAFRCHPSQYGAFSGWLHSADTAAGIRLYNPREYGLYRSTVGGDYSGDTFFDNLTLYDEAERLAVEEAERLAAEEEARLAAEEEARLAAEEAARQAEAERVAQQDAQSAAARQEFLAAERRQLYRFIALAASVAAAALLVVIALRAKEKSEREKEDKKK